jgi:hypothetical protein
MSEQIPSIGRSVVYHHPIDGKDWPALIMEVTGGKQPDVVVDDEAKTILVGEFIPYRAHLTIFRPRGIDWKWSSEGEGGGQWSWPKMIGPGRFVPLGPGEIWVREEPLSDDPWKEPLSDDDASELDEFKRAEFDD